jgi:hypothetical protein
VSIFKRDCTHTDHLGDLAELREIYRKELAARDEEIARLNRELQNATAHRVVPYADDGGGAEYEQGSPSWT